MNAIKILSRNSNELVELENDFKKWVSEIGNIEIINILQSVSPKYVELSEEAQDFKSESIFLTIHYKI